MLRKHNQNIKGLHFRLTGFVLLIIAIAGYSVGLSELRNIDNDFQVLSVDKGFSFFSFYDIEKESDDSGKDIWILRTPLLRRQTLHSAGDAMESITTGLSELDVLITYLDLPPPRSTY